MSNRWQVELLVFVALITSIVSAASETSWLGPEFGILQRVYDDCQDKNDIVGCLKGKALSAINKAVDQESLSVLDGISFVKQNETEQAPSEGRFLSGLSGIDRSLVEKLDKFFRTHTLKVDLNEAREKGEGGGFGGHGILGGHGGGNGGGFGGGGGGGGFGGLGGGGGGGLGGGLGGNKKAGKKYGRYVMAALLTAMGIAGPLGLKALAAIAGKALVISKVALTIAGIIALKKIFSSDHHEETSFQVHAGGDHNRRNTYLVRPVKAANGQYVDPYRYYYEHYPSNPVN
ncbi:osiris 21 [Sergentomyia squamirostris]